MALRLFLIGVLVAFVLVSDAMADERVRLPQGEARQTTARDLAPHRETSGAFNERWSYNLQLDGDLQLAINFSLARLAGFREPTVSADLAIMGLGGQDYYVAREYPVATRFRFDASRSRLEAHPTIFFEGAPPQRHKIHFQTEKDGVAYLVDLTFSEMAPGMTWGDGRFQLGAESIGMFIHIPYARVTGTVSVNGQQRRVRGTAYMDHTYQTTYPPRLVRAAFRMVHHRSDGWEVGYFLLPSSRYEDTPVGFALRSRGRTSTLLRPDAVDIINTRPALGLSVPGQLRIVYGDGSQTLLTRRRDRQAFSAFEELGGIARMAARRLIGGELYYFRGTGTLGTGHAAAYDYLIVR